jgi:RNA polymerase sigma factor (sigma-70 family)
MDGGGNGAGMTTPNVNALPDLLAEGAWARRLAARLVRADDADDLVQDTWAAVGERPVPSGVSPRQWLAGVMRNLARQGRRSLTRQQDRERRTGALVHGATVSRPDQLAEQLETQRLLAGLVLGLAPLYRDVVLLRFYDDLSTDQVAARLAVPPGTARRRLAMAIAQLRGQLEARDVERGTAWRRSLAVFAAGGTGRIRPVIVTAAKGAAVAAVVVIAAIPLLGQGAPATARPPSPPPADPSAPYARVPAFSAPPALASVAPDDVPEGAGAPAEAPGPRARAEAAERYKIPLGTGPVRGPANARVTILEFVDYQCVFTARAQAALTALLTAHARDVRFQVIQRPLPFHPQAGLLARAALAADAQGRFWEMHALLLAHPRERWTLEGLARHARDLGLDEARFRVDLEAEATRLRLQADGATAAGAGIAGTPVFFVNGRPLIGADAPAAMPAVLAEETARADALLAGGADRAGLYDALVAGGKETALQSREPPPEPSRPRASFESVFTSAGSCAPPIGAPTELDFSFPPGAAGGGRVILSWSMTGSGARRYRTDYQACNKAVWLRSVSAGPEDFIAEHQTVLADAYRGKRVRFRAEIDGQDIEPWAGLFMRVEGDDGRVIASERARLMPADRGWRPAEVVLAIPADARAFSYWAPARWPRLGGHAQPHRRGGGALSGSPLSDSRCWPGPAGPGDRRAGPGRGCAGSPGCSPTR